MSPTPPPAFAVTSLPTDEASDGADADADRVERWVGVSATVVVMLAGMAALLV